MANILSPQQKLNKLKHHQLCYISKAGGPFSIREGDEIYNKLTQMIITAFSKVHPKSYLGNINLYGIEHEDVANGKAQALKEYHGEKVYNFSYDFIVPVKDQTLEELLHAYNQVWAKETSVIDLLDAIIKRVYEIGGELLLWK